jgi:hypothetical protein
LHATHSTYYAYPHIEDSSGITMDAAVIAETAREPKKIAIATML